MEPPKTCCLAIGQKCNEETGMLFTINMQRKDNFKQSKLIKTITVVQRLNTINFRVITLQEPSPKRKIYLHRKTSTINRKPLLCL